MSRPRTRMTDNVEWVIRADNKEAPAFYGGPLAAWRSKGTEVMLSGVYESGKGLPLDSVVFTPTGERRIADLHVGDAVLSWDGYSTPVTGIHLQGVRDVYRVTFADGRSVVTDGDHQWLVGRRLKERVSSTENLSRPAVRGSGYDGYRTFTTAELFGKNLTKKVGSKKETRRRYWIPVCLPAQFERRPLPVDPYLLGVLLSEGALTGTGKRVVGYTSADPEIAAEIRRRTGLKVRKRSADYAWVVDSDGFSWKDALGGLNGASSESMFIPADYLHSDVDDRLALLRGLMDGDGTVDKRGYLEYTSVSRQLAEDVRFLVESMGGVVWNIHEKPCAYRKGDARIYTGKTGYTVAFALPPEIVPVTLPRKAARLKITARPRRFFASIEYVGRQETVCISVAHPSQLYLTDHFIVTHNTFSALYKMHNLALKYPGCRILLARKLYSSLVSTALVTYYRKVLPYPPEHPLCPVTVFGGSRPETIIYPNGSMMVVAGLDNADKVLSAEYDFVYVNQAEELSLHDWEQILSRTTGRAGNAPYSQVFGDCNPGAPNHWILNRPSLELYTATHQDNPMLYDHKAGEWTAQGKRTISILSTMTGLRYKRGFLGLWAGAEGQIYESFDEQVHIVDPFPIPDSWRRWRVIDFGYTHPFSCQWWAQDHKGTLYMYREIYMSGRIVDEHVNGADGKPGILELSAGERYEATICDHDAEDRATLEKNGIKTKRADKAIRQGIEAVQIRLRVDADGNSGIYFFRDALVEEDDKLRTRYKPLSVVGEFGGYAWPSFDARRREANSRDEIPIRADDHGLDCLRYVVMEVDGRKKVGQAKVIAYA